MSAELVDHGGMPVGVFECTVNRLGNERNGVKGSVMKIKQFPRLDELTRMCASVIGMSGRSSRCWRRS